MIEIYDLLIYIQMFELKALILALLAYSLYFARRDSFSITLLLATSLYLLHVGIEAALGYFGDLSIFTLFGYTLNPAYIEYVVYHPTYAFTDFAFLYLVSFCLNKFKYKETKASRYLVFMYLVHGFYQMLAFADFVVFETNWMDGIYRVIVPTLDGAMVFTVCLYVFGVISMDLLQKKREA